MNWEEKSIKLKKLINDISEACYTMAWTNNPNEILKWMTDLIDNEIKKDPWLKDFNLFKKNISFI